MTDEQNSVTPERDTSQTAQIKRLQRRMDELGICSMCGEIMDMDEEGPFSHCQCGTAEDYAKRPIQALQVRAMRAEAGRDRLAEENRRLREAITDVLHGRKMDRAGNRNDDGMDMARIAKNLHYPDWWHDRLDTALPQPNEED